jgi:hypothetical protein
VHTRLPRSLAAALLGLSLSGCGPGDPVDDVLTAPLYVPPGGVLDGLRIVVPYGRALAFVAQPMGRGETLKLRIRLSSDAQAVAEVEETVEMNQFVALGRGVGHATVSIVDEAGRRAETTFDVEVVEP